MPKAFEVLKYMRGKQHFTGEMQRHKLLYYVQAWSLAWTGRPLFDDRVEAWTLGPVVPNVRNAILPLHPTTGSLSREEQALVDAVLDHYGRLGGAELSNLTHQERPWLDARAGLPDDAPSSAEISHDAMRREYTMQSLQGKGPQRPGIPPQEADLDDVLNLAEVASSRWSRTLALLAE